MSRVNLAKRQQRIEAITRYLEQGMAQVDIAPKVGMTASNICTFIKLHVKRPAKPAKPMLPKTREMVARVRPLVESGLLPTQIAAKVGINVDIVRHILRRYCHRPYLKVRKHACASNARPGWGTETADPSTLTPEQLETARRVGITPERFAWLCAIPKNPDAKRGAVGHRGGNHIG